VSCEVSRVKVGGRARESIVRCVKVTKLGDGPFPLAGDLRGAVMTAAGAIGP
jgi:hypothetical protein